MISNLNIIIYFVDPFRHPDFTPPADQISEETVTLGLMPFYHAYGLFGILIGSLFGGSKIVCLSKFKPEVFLGAIEKYKASELIDIMISSITYLLYTNLTMSYSIDNKSTFGSAFDIVPRQISFGEEI